jgi:hypothetical protein
VSFDPFGGLRETGCFKKLSWKNTLCAQGRPGVKLVGPVAMDRLKIDYPLQMKDLDRRISVAPMMDWAD